MMSDAPATHPGNESKGRGARFWILAIIIGVAIIVAAILIYQASMAAFTAQTATGQSSFATGEIDLTNDSEADSVFNLTDLQPGDSGTSDVVVNYTGTLDSEVKLYAESTGGDQSLADNLRLTITADGATGSPWTGTLAQFQQATDFASGILPVLMTEGGDSQTYVVDYTVLDTAAEGTTADVTFVWEAQSQSEN